MNRSLEIEVKVGIFVVIGTALLMVGIMMLGGGVRGIFKQNLMFNTRFSEIDGIIEGANVKLGGIKIGKVEKINFLRDDNQIEILFSVDPRFKDAIHEDATITTQTQGVLGDKFLVINPGTPGAPLAKDGATLVKEVSKGFSDYLNTADQVLARLKGSLGYIEGILGDFKKEKRTEILVKNLSGFSSTLTEVSGDLKQSSHHLKSILTKIDSGEGTIGALVNDPSLYEDMKSLVGGANRNKVLKFFVKQSVEKSRSEAAKNAEKK